MLKTLLQKQGIFEVLVILFDIIIYNPHCSISIVTYCFLYNSKDRGGILVLKEVPWT